LLLSELVAQELPKLSPGVAVYGVSVSRQIRESNVSTIPSSFVSIPYCAFMKTTFSITGAQFAAVQVPPAHEQSAVRIALVVRSSQFEKTQVSPASFTLWPDATSNSGCNNAAALTNPPNTGPVGTVPDRQYRYRIFETFVPLRNSIWMPG
jgi:hypothetical protein